MNQLTRRWTSALNSGRALFVQHREKWPLLAGLTLACLLYAFGKIKDERIALIQFNHSSANREWKDARILGSQDESIYEGKERLLNKAMKELKGAQQELRQNTEKLQARLAELEKGSTPEVRPIQGPSPVPTSPEVSPVTSDVDLSRPPAVPSEVFAAGQGNAGLKGQMRTSQSAILSFPVKDASDSKAVGVVLPLGSYVKAKLMTGVEAPEGRTYPVLLQLDFAYIVPNQKKIDLSGCFMIAKSQGDLSTERVQMQANRLSCVSKGGKMFEREVSGFVADDKDNSFAVIGSVNSKQDRVAAMGFLSAVVQGIGQAIQHSQATQTMNPLGGSQSMVTGNQMEYIGAGGAASAAGQVTQWYLKQAQNLLPTINVGSGQDVWVVMQETVQLPAEYFRKLGKGEIHESQYSYFSRVAD